MTHIKYNLFRFKTSQQAHHGQMMSKQRYINFDTVGITLFLRGFTMICQLGLAEREVCCSTVSLMGITCSCNIEEGCAVVPRFFEHAVFRILRFFELLPPLDLPYEALTSTTVLCSWKVYTFLFYASGKVQAKCTTLY